jgi:hypothetical protein
MNIFDKNLNRVIREFCADCPAHGFCSLSFLSNFFLKFYQIALVNFVFFFWLFTTVFSRVTLA